MTPFGKTIFVLGILCSFQVVTIYSRYRTENIKLSDGSTVTGLKGFRHHFFVGIPYAKPPVGDLRFADPVPIHWTGNKNATLMKPPCLQTNILNRKPPTIGSEDCLYLTIYRPDSDYERQDLDVMVYIHGDGFDTGHIQPTKVGPMYFMKRTRSVIMVMMQYRLSVLGFLSTGDMEAPGNFGLKDQTLALKWIKKNIKGFGGNPNSITIFGHGVSVHMHMLSPLSRGLFHKAIAMSGNAIDPFNFPTQNPIRLAQRMATALGISDVEDLSSKELLQKLRNVSALDLMRGVQLLKPFLDHPLSLFRPVVEPYTDDAFITDDPWTLLKNGKVAKVPFMTGVVDEEGFYRGATFSHENLLRHNDILDQVLPMILQFNITGERLANFMGKLKHRFLNDLAIINDENENGFIQMFTEYGYYYPLYKSLPYMIKKMPVYLYHFSYKGHVSYSYYHAGAVKDYGVVHNDDLIYLFGNSLHASWYALDELANQKLIQLYATFAHVGDPGWPRCYEMQPMCNYGHFYKNTSGMIDIEKINVIDETLVPFWDQLYTDDTKDSTDVRDKSYGTVSHYPDESKNNKIDPIDELRKLNMQNQYGNSIQNRRGPQFRKRAHTENWKSHKGAFVDELREKMKLNNGANFEEIVRLLRKVVSLFPQKSTETGAP